MDKDLSKKKNKEALNFYYSQKVISRLDEIVNESNVENFFFDPIPLGNSVYVIN